MKIGLVLSGGISKGAYQAGFLRSWEEHGLTRYISSISCASIGLFSGYALSSGKVGKFCDIWENIHFDSPVDLACEVWFKHYLKNMIGEFVREEDRLSIPVYAPICYILPLIRMEYCKLYGSYMRSWSKFILGAVSYPLITGGIHTFRGQITFDGGAMDNIPVFPLIKYERPDLILVLHFESGYRPRKIHLSSGIPIADFDISIGNAYKRHSFDFHTDTLKTRLAHGYNYGERFIKDNLLGNMDDLEQACAAIRKQQEAERSQRMDNVTFDTWVRRLNDLFYPYVSRCKIKLRDLTSNSRTTRKKQEVTCHADQKMP